MLKKQIDATKNFVSQHKTAIAVVGTAVVTTAAFVAFDRGRVKQWNGFLAEHDLTDAFYTAE